MSVFLQSLDALRPIEALDLGADRPTRSFGSEGVTAAQLDAMPAYNQHGAAALQASRPFAVGHAGYDYFADEQHYRSLAGRILAGLQQGGRIAAVTGDLPINPLSLARTLTDATSGKHAVLALACGGKFNEAQLRRAPGRSPLFLFHEVDRLSDRQLAELSNYLASGGNRLAGVLVGRTGFVPRLEELQPNLFEDGRVIHFNFYELGRDEIDAFIRRQLIPNEADGSFAVDDINWIADLSGGDPTQVNRLARLVLALTSSVECSARCDSSPQHVLTPSAPRCLRAMKWPAVIAVLLCFGMGVLLMLGGGPEFHGRINAPAESSGGSSPVLEQAAISPAAPPSAETAPATEPVAAPSTAETAPSTEPAAEPPTAETVPSTEPAAEPLTAETAPSTEPVAEPPTAETAPSTEPVAEPSTAETAPSTGPATTPRTAETAPSTKSATAPRTAESAPFIEPVAAPPTAETAP